MQNKYFLKNITSRLYAKDEKPTSCVYCAAKNNNNMFNNKK